MRLELKRAVTLILGVAVLGMMLVLLESLVESLAASIITITLSILIYSMLTRLEDVIRDLKNAVREYMAEEFQQLLQGALP